ncbi:MAG: hypothetical protein ACTHXO_00945 [Actinomycetaceae bacterium]
MPQPPFHGDFRIRVPDAQADLAAFDEARRDGARQLVRWCTLTGIAVLALAALLVTLLPVSRPEGLGASLLGLAVPFGVAAVAVLICAVVVRRGTERRALARLPHLRASMSRQLRADGHADADSAAVDLLLRARFRRDGTTYALRADGEELGLVAE